MDITKKPVAILGNGPCLDDIHDPDGLLEQRFVIAINGAAKRMPFHALCLYDYAGVAHGFHKLVKQHHWLFLSMGTMEGGLLSTVPTNKVSTGEAMKNRYSKVQFAVDEACGNHQNILVIPKDARLYTHTKQGSLCVLLRWLELYYGIRGVELYGFDLGPPYDLWQHPPLLQCVHDGLRPMNCCPNSTAPVWLPHAFVPWTYLEEEDA